MTPSSATTLEPTKVSTGSSSFAVGSSQFSWLQKLARKRVLKWLEEIDGGSIQFADPQTHRLFGTSESDSMSAEWIVRNPEFYSQLATGGSLGLAESYLRGHWKTNDLTRLLTILCRNMNRASKATPYAVAAAKLSGHLKQWFNRNTRGQCRRQIATHYDLSNDFFALFLDPTLMYSSAYFENDTTTLHEASIAKLERICSKLNLQETDRVLEIGTGWGGFALHAVKNHGIDLTTTTISAAQLTKARERVRDAGIEDRVQLLDSDYRDLEGQYDKLVSIEMVEAVGEKFLDAYFQQCGRLMKPGGRFVMQAIVMPEQRYQAYRRGTDFIQKYIFPGGFLPSVAAMQQAVGRTSDLRLAELEDLSTHYARTLKAWRERFFDRIDEVWQLGFDDRFIRMWEYYLCYCEAAFREQAVRVVQIVWDKPKK